MVYKTKYKMKVLPPTLGFQIRALQQENEMMVEAINKVNASNELLRKEIEKMRAELGK